MACPSTKTRTPSTGLPAWLVIVPLTTFARRVTVRSPSSGTVPEAGSWPSAVTATAAPRIAATTAVPSAAVVAVEPSMLIVAPAIGASDPCSTAVTVSSRGCSGVGSAVGMNGSGLDPPQAASSDGQDQEGSK